jgi:heme exporter protein C
MTLDAAAATRAIRLGRVLTVVALVALAGIYVMALQFTPPERFQGLAQKIFYLHVPTAWSALLAFSLVGVASILFLWLKDYRLDAFAEASAEVGLVLAGLILLTGPLWGKPVWGVWWSFTDARLMFTLLEFLLFVGYFALRSAMTDPFERARFAAVLGIMGLLLVPFIHLTVYLFSTIHPTPIVAKPDKPSLPWEMLRTLLSSFGVFTLIYLGMVMQRYGIGVRRMIEETTDA